MARKATGQVIEPDGKQRSWALRFRAYGKRRFVTLGRPEDGWTRQRAEAELRHVLADVERGIWRHHEPVSAPPTDVPTFHEFASEWLDGRRGRAETENHCRLRVGSLLPPAPGASEAPPR